MKLLLLLVYLVHLLKAQVVLQEKCPNVSDLSNPLDKEKLLGTWYVYKLFPNPHDNDLKCSEDHIEAFNGDNFEGTFYYVNETNNMKVEGSYVSIKKQGSHGVFTTKYILKNGAEVQLSYKIVDVDYDHYTISWFCTEMDGTSYRLVWVETKSKAVSDEVLDKIHKFFDKHNLGASNLVLVEQENCDV